MKELWLKKNECTGCSACANACPKNAISMKTDEYGFIYPVINENCINCNACENICEARFKKTQNFYLPDTYAAWSNDKNIRYNSTSGGVFSELSKIILETGGYVVGAAYNDELMVEHKLVCDTIGLESIRQSKYIQSNIGYVFRDVKKKLIDGYTVAFCGSPCQIAGLKSFLGEEYENLYTFDFICRGMNSPKAYRSWLDEIEMIYGSKVKKVWFKYKEDGWKQSPKCTRIDFTDGSNKVFKQDENLFMKGYLGANLFIRSSCGDCKFKGVPRQGDITLADFWGIEKSIDDDKGTSMVLINNNKGKILFDKAKLNMSIFKRDFEEIYEGNVCFNSSVKIDSNSEKFLKELDNKDFSITLKKYTKVSIPKKIVRKIKRLINNL